MMYISTKLYTVCGILLLLSVKSESRQEEDLAVMFYQSDKYMCVMVDRPTRHQLDRDYNKQMKEYTLFPMLSTDGCKNLTNSGAKQKLVVQKSNICSVQQQMEIAMNAGASGIMIIIRNLKKDQSYPFELSVNKSSNVSFPIIILTESTYLSFIRNVTSNKIWLKGFQQEVKLPLSIIGFHLIAFVCLVTGGYLSIHGLNGVPPIPIFGDKKIRTQSSEERSRSVTWRVPHSDGINGVEVQHNESRSQTLTMAISCFITIAISVSMLLILYFFYDVFVYIFIGLICIVFSTSLKSMLMEVICRLPKLKDIDIKFKFKNGCVKMFVGPEIDLRSVIIYPLCMVPAIVWLIYRKDLKTIWILQDVLGIVACIYISKVVRIGNLKMITIFYCGFFLYDIFMVYITPLFTSTEVFTHLKDPLYHSRSKRASGSSIMERVATGSAGKSGEKLPIVFLIPYLDMYGKKIINYCANLSKMNFSLLGFGDILVPGVLVTFAFYADQRLRALPGRCLRYFYFPIVVAGYHIGLMLVFLLLAVMQTGQPALITLIPCTLIPFIIAAAIRKDIQMVWAGVFPCEVGSMDSAEEEDWNDSSPK